MKFIKRLFCKHEDATIVDKSFYLESIYTAVSVYSTQTQECKFCDKVIRKTNVDNFYDADTANVFLSKLSASGYVHRIDSKY